MTHQILKSWATVLALLCATLGPGCGGGTSGGPTFEVSFDPAMPKSTRDLALRVEVYLVDSCDGLAIGTRPVPALASAFVLRDGDAGSLGDGYAPGDYGLYAVAQDANCAVIAAGCALVTIADDESALAVTIGAFPSEGCPTGAQCSLRTGDCIDGGGTGGTGGSGGAGGGVGGTGGTGGDPVLDCTDQPDEAACLSGATPGRCWAGACCTGCWDGVTCQGGNDANRCGAAGALCKFCDCASDACVAGTCTATPSIVDFDMGREHACAIGSDGRMWCWGSDEDDQLSSGDGNPTFCGFFDPCFLEPHEIDVEDADPRWTSVSAGQDVTCGIDASDSSLWCWGSNDDGRMGAPSNVSGANAPRLISAATHQKVDNRRSNGCALRTNGRMWCWGANDHGQVGQGTTSQDVFEPLEVPYASDWDEMSVGEDYVCAIRQQRLWCWGTNTYGQLGIGSTGDTVHPAETGFEGSGVEAGEDTTCGLDTEGVGFCWGRNSYGQVGNGDTSGTNAASPTPIAGSLLFDHFSLGEEFTCAVTVSGALYCWGRNHYDQLGIAEPGQNQVEIPTRVGTESSWLKVAAQGDSACGLQEGGTLWCWGRNHRGQLGVGDTDERMSPTRVCF